MGNESHELTLIPDKNTGLCLCGTEFVGIPKEIVEQWEVHLKIGPMLDSAKVLVAAEYQARAESELTIKKLLELGVTSTQIVEAIGADTQGRPLVSKTTVQRLGRNGYEQTPRRRRRNGA